MTGEEGSVDIAKTQFDEGRYVECLTTLSSLSATSSPLNAKVILTIVTNYNFYYMVTCAVFAG